MRYIFIIVFPQHFFCSNNLPLPLVRMIDDSIECDHNNSSLIIILISFILWHCADKNDSHTFHFSYQNKLMFSRHLETVKIKSLSPRVLHGDKMWNDHCFDCDTLSLI